MADDDDNEELAISGDGTAGDKLPTYWSYMPSYSGVVEGNVLKVLFHVHWATALAVTTSNLIWGLVVKSNFNYNSEIFNSIRSDLRAKLFKL